MNVSNSSINVNEPATGKAIKTEQVVNDETHIQVMRLGRTDYCNYGPLNVLSGTQIVSQNSNRLEIVICNNSQYVVYLSFNDAGGLNQGVRLNPNGGTFTSVNYTGPIYGWASTSAAVTFAEIGEPSA
jgi:hypothetical protein